MLVLAFTRNRSLGTGNEAALPFPPPRRSAFETSATARPLLCHLLLTKVAVNFCPSAKRCLCLRSFPLLFSLSFHREKLNFLRRDSILSFLFFFFFFVCRALAREPFSLRKREERSNLFSCLEKIYIDRINLENDASEFVELIDMISHIEITVGISNFWSGNTWGNFFFFLRHTLGYRISWLD